MVVNKKRKKWQKVLFWIACTLVLLIVGIAIAGWILERRFPKILTTAVYEKSNGVYRLVFNDLQMDLWRGGLTLEQVHLSPDSSAYHRQEAKPTKLYDVSLKTIRISGLNIWTLIFSKKVHVQTIEVDQPTILQVNMEAKQPKKDKINWKQQLQQWLPNGKINRFLVKNLQFKAADNLHDASPNGWLSRINMDIKQIAIHDTAHRDATTCWFAKDIRVYGNNIRYISTDGVYQFRLAKMDISTKQQRLTIDSLRVIPTYTETQWSKTLPYKRDRYDMLYPKIEASLIAFKKLETQGRLLLDTLSIIHPVLHIYADKGMPEHTTIASNNFPSLAFQRLALPITVKQINLKHVDIYYKERNPKSGKAGTVIFRQLMGTLKQVSNDTVELKKSPWINCHFSTLFLGQPRLTVDLNFNMLDTAGGFNYQGSLSGAPASLFNQILEPLTLARAEQGYINQIRFDVKANRYGARVKTVMLYRDFKLALLDAESGKLAKKGILSLFINWVAIKRNNPDKVGDPPRMAAHWYAHDQERTFFNLMWKAVYSGLKVNLGLPK